MNRRVRLWMLGVALPGLSALVAWAIAGLPAFGDYRGPYGFVLNRIAVPLRHTTNVVMATTFDVRGVDTMGEEFILFAAVLGVTLLLREEVRERRAERNTRRLRSEAARLTGVLFVGAGVLIGLWLIAFGYVTPGGGFQGGVVVAGAILVVYLAGSHRDYHPFRNEHVLDPLEAVGVGGYVIVGLAALTAGAAFLTNLFGAGLTGTLESGGSIPLLNWASGIAVSVALLLLFAEFLETYDTPFEPEDVA